MTAPPLVLIEWEDSAQPIAGWQWLDSFDSFEVVRCQTVGWLIHDGDDVKAVAQNMGNLGADGGTQVSGVIRIPARCVVAVRPLKETRPGPVKLVAGATARASLSSGLG